MNEYPRLKARVVAAEEKLEALEQHAKRAENLIIRLAEQINELQHQRKPGRPRKETNGTI